MEKEVGEVGLVGLRADEGLRVLSRRPAEQPGDGEVLGQPVPLPQEGTVEQRSRRPSVPIHEGMQIGQVEMQGDSPHHRVHEGFRRFAVGEGHEQIDPLRQIVGRRGYEYRIGILEVAHYHPFLPWLLDASGVFRTVQSSFGNFSVYVQYRFNRQRSFGIAADFLHCPIVVHHHVLGVVGRRLARAEQLSGIPAGGGSPFEQAGSNRLLHQARNYVAVSVSGADHIFGQTDASGGLLVDLVQQRVHLVGQHVAEGMLQGVGERQQPPSLQPRELDAEPPLLQRKAFRRRPAANIFPVVVAPSGGNPYPLAAQYLNDPLGFEILEQFPELRGSTRLPHHTPLPRTIDSTVPLHIL